MVTLTYKIANDGFINLYEIIDGKENYLRDFVNRENLLLYIEKNYDIVNLIIIEKGEK